MRQSTYIDDILAQLRLNRDFMDQVVAWERLLARVPDMREIPDSVNPDLAEALRARGFSHLYTHQQLAWTAVQDGEHIVVATTTASGKSLCYTVPVLHHLLNQPEDRALYLFPTKALAHDQMAETQALINAGGLPLQVNSYDGDTPRSRRRQIRQSSGVLITNPDMLHGGILPYHTGWRPLFANLRYVVLDEIHAYRGIFGSHVANVLRRLRRICHFYGCEPQFICCSATIANPREHAQRLVERPFTLIDESANGAPSGARDVILYNPPVVDETLGLRGSAVLAAKDAAVTFLARDVQTIIFARARQTVELLLAYLQDELSYQGKADTVVAGYRGGYLPLERRQIEAGLRDGTIRGVVSTNALELGIDVGELDVAVLTGYPGSVASTWQQAGRAGRRNARSLAIIVASNNPLDQYICHHPRYLFGRSPEHALTNPDNLRILAKHLLCAAYELPFQPAESFGSFDPISPLLAALADTGLLHETRSQYHWLGDTPPAGSISLRTSGDDTVVIQTSSEDNEEPGRIIGEIDLESVPLMAYEGAIYMHQAQTYLVTDLDWEGRLAIVKPVAVDYYTRASVGSMIRELTPEREQDAGDLTRAYGDVAVVTQATGFRKIKRYTHETLGYGQIDLPEIALETAGYWLILGQKLTERLMAQGILLPPNEYGPNWQQQRQAALERDQHRCRTCGAQARPGQGLHIHHIRPFREYGYRPGENEHYLQANVLDNLVTLCPSCHQRAEEGQRSRSALAGLAYVLRNLAPLFLMCDPSDIQVSAESRNPLTQAPTIVVYERVAAGVGFSQRLFELHAELLAAALELVQDCRCRDGCPACVGPPGEIGPATKLATQRLLSVLCDSDPL